MSIFGFNFSIGKIIKKGMLEQFKTLCGEDYKEFNSKRLLELGHEDAKKLIQNLRKRGLSNATLDKYLRNLKIVFNSLETELQLRKEKTNPFEGIKVGSVKRSEKPSLNALTEYETVKQELIKEAKRYKGKNKEAIFYLIALTSMMRRGEIAALCWEDIDFENKVMRVIGVIEANEFGGGVSYRDSIKNGEKRLTVLDPEVVLLLKELKIIQGNRSTWKDSEGRRHNLVFRKVDDTPYGLKHWSDEWRNIRNEFLIQGIIGKLTTLHDLRGSGITYHLLVLHTPVNVVSNIVGHEDVSITLNVYANAEEESVYELAREINKISNVKVSNKKTLKTEFLD